MVAMDIMDDEDELPIETIGWVGRNMMIGWLQVTMKTTRT